MENSDPRSPLRSVLPTISVCVEVAGARPVSRRRAGERARAPVMSPRRRRLARAAVLRPELRASRQGPPSALTSTFCFISSVPFSQPPPLPPSVPLSCSLTPPTHPETPLPHPRLARMLKNWQRFPKQQLDLK